MFLRHVFKTSWRPANVCWVTTEGVQLKGCNRGVYHWRVATRKLWLKACNWGFENEGLQLKWQKDYNWKDRGIVTKRLQLNAWNWRWKVATEKLGIKGCDSRLGTRDKRLQLKGDWKVGTQSLQLKSSSWRLETEKLGLNGCHWRDATDG